MLFINNEMVTYVILINLLFIIGVSNRFFFFILLVKVYLVATYETEWAKFTIIVLKLIYSFYRKKIQIQKKENSLLTFSRFGEFLFYFL